MKKKSSKNPKKEAEARSKTLTAAELNSAVQAAELLDIKLTESSFSVKPEFFSTSIIEPNVEKELKYGFDKIVYHVDALENKDGCAGTAFADVSATVLFKSKIVLEIKAKYLISYSFEKMMIHDAAEAFLRRVASFSIYPYFRQLVAMYSAACGADLPTLPVFKEAVLAASKSSEKPV